MILIMGPAGAGKSIQGRILAQSHGYHWISIGRLLRDATQDYHLIKKMEEGEMLNDEFVETVVATALQSVEHPDKVILDGFPRRVSQADWLLKYSEKYELTVDQIVHIELDLEEAENRLMLRARTDDHKEAIKRRFEEYRTETLKIIGYMEEKGVRIAKVNGQGTVKEVHQRIVNSIEQ